MVEYILQQETYNIRRCLMNVFNELGSGFLEKVYQEALEIELRSAGIPFKREAHISISYKGVPLQLEYVADYICYDKIIVELKAVSELTDVHKAQVYNYLKATNLDLGLLVNFGESELNILRLYNYRKT